MAKVFTSLKREPPKWVIDRIEDDVWAVLENTETREVISLPLSGLPKGADAGSTLIKTEGKWYINEADSAARHKRINDRFTRIKNGGGKQ
jgi:hypothetical protein